jgi:hypothetical protein
MNQRISKLQNIIVQTIADGNEYDYNSTAKYICVTYLPEYNITKWILQNQALPEKFAVSFTRSIHLLIVKGIIYPFKPTIYRRTLKLQLTPKGKELVKKHKITRPEVELKGYKWI